MHARDEVFGGAENHWRYNVAVDRLPLRHIGRGGHFSAGRRCYRVVYLLVRVRGHICLGPTDSHVAARWCIEKRATDSNLYRTLVHFE